MEKERRRSPPKSLPDRGGRANAGLPNLPSVLRREHPHLAGTHQEQHLSIVSSLSPLSDDGMLLVCGQKHPGREWAVLCALRLAHLESDMREEELTQDAARAKVYEHAKAASAEGASSAATKVCRMVEHYYLEGPKVCSLRSRLSTSCLSDVFPTQKSNRWGVRGTRRASRCCGSVPSCP